MDVRSEPPPILDLDRLKIVSMGDSEFERELLELFLSDSVAQCDRLREAFNERDWPAAAKATHRVRGAALNIGAQALSAACLGLEGAIGSAAAPAQALAALERAYEETCHELRRLLGAATARSA